MFWFRNHVNEGAMTSKEKIWEQAREDSAWAMQNEAWQRQYDGQLIVVHHKQVIAHGVDRAQLLAEAERRGYSREEVVVVAMLSAEFEAPPDELT